MAGLVGGRIDGETDGRTVGSAHRAPCALPYPPIRLPSYRLPAYATGMPRVLILLGALASLVSVAPLDAQQTRGDPPTLRTRWADDVDSAHVLPAYPRPYLRRERWINLNGAWEYAIVDSADTRPSAFDGTILVPFPVESQLSGVQLTVTPEQRVWYRRTFAVEDRVPGERWLLHFGAVDWETRVWVNGHELGTHRGGYDPFSYDITDALSAGGSQEIVLAVWDPTDQGEQPRGKQVLDPRGIWYTAVTGIWQTVWLEPVPAAHVDDLRVVPRLSDGTVTLRVAATGASDREIVTARAFAGDSVVAVVRGPVGRQLTLALADPRPWQPDDPFLYDLEVSLASGDTVRSYVGMRDIAVGPDVVGTMRLLLNGRPLFQYGLLDQGWWPDGLYTAPTEDALRYDLEVTKRLGFTMIRKHVKVEPERWYYLADSLGLLVWQDMPSGDNEGPEARAQFALELDALVAARRHHPSIVMWVPFNEGWGQHETERYVARLRRLDPTRPVNNASGWTDAGVGDVIDVHRYPGPGVPEVEPDRAAVLGEFGGLGLPLPGHTWVEEGNWGYRGFQSLEELRTAYRGLLHQLRFLIGDGLAAAVYTQTTDVEVEVNGIMTYDREVVKLPDDIVSDHAALFGAPPLMRPIVPTSRTEPQRWHYSVERPAEGWHRPAFDDSRWREGPGGFGTEGTPGAHVGTAWTTSDLWLRRSFTLRAVPESLHLRVHHDETAEVYVNGVLVAELQGYTTGYVVVPLDDAGRQALESGVNLLAVHVHQTDGGQYIDVGLVEILEP